MGLYSKSQPCCIINTHAQTHTLKSLAGTDKSSVSRGVLCLTVHRIPSFWCLHSYEKQSLRWTVAALLSMEDIWFICFWYFGVWKIRDLFYFSSTGPASSFLVMWTHMSQKEFGRAFQTALSWVLKWLWWSTSQVGKLREQCAQTWRPGTGRTATVGGLEAGRDQGAWVPACDGKPWKGVKQESDSARLHPRSFWLWFRRWIWKR